MSDEVILYDLPSKQGTSWSLNPWKTRLVLNYKSIPYKTEWTEYPDLKPKFEKFGIPPNQTGAGAAYSSPAIRMPDGSYVMDSRRIVDALESLQPTPPLHLDSPYQARIEDLTKQIVDSIRPVFMPLVPKVFLNPTSRDYFVSTRTKALGMSLDEYAKGADKGVQKAKPYIRELGELLRENNEGPFLQGKTPCYADMIVLGWLTMLDRLGVGDSFFGLEDGGEELKRLYDEGVKQGWFERDSY
ncbi:hypothetical protein LTR99_007816 [Exophiala xenobiotica]|nr:hypothetical protein LTR92_003386 [Exophiala xenobiotica]KAK5223793.1 hypothetical protein LTR72_005179 [Exophiala xenobiotica]KAK5236484.1 hypothetical protein LTR47_002435 [Exophiala xenobiotica]KAK5289194.1 hypothetical protein LTR14_007445 [Exophiala xenobiotica]KAK5298127.1 hypothetical protein LTR99_007816 [Exophiala xenobiotica]